jgi:lipopolysaccharide transport system ATP-binding protein
MSQTVIAVENLSKSYRLGTIGTGTFTNDLKVWWARKRGKANPLAKIGEADHEEGQGETIWALKNIDFTVNQGEVLGIIGRNGSGKSTLLKILSRVTSPTTGIAKLKGRVASLLEVGTGFHPELTGRENIFLNGAILGMSQAEIRRKLDEIVDFSGVEKFIDTPVKRYSSGMYVRLAFAVAAHLEPEILIVDEVLAVGDVEFQGKCLGKMGQQAKSGKTVLFVSHNMESIIRLCSHSICLDRGQLIHSGNSRDTVEFYLTKYRQEQSREIDLSLTKRPESLSHSPFRIIKSKLLGGTDQLIYKIGEPIRFELTYQCDSTILGLRIGLGLNTPLGQRLCTFHSPVDWDISSSGQNQIGLIIDTTQLKPGTYSVDVGARSGKVTYDFVIGIASLEISYLNIENSLSDDDNYGLVSVKHSWFQIENK